MALSSPPTLCYQAMADTRRLPQPTDNPPCLVSPTLTDNDSVLDLSLKKPRDDSRLEPGIPSLKERHHHSSIPLPPLLPRDIRETTVSTLPPPVLHIKQEYPQECPREYAPPSLAIAPRFESKPFDFSREYTGLGQGLSVHHNERLSSYHSPHMDSNISWEHDSRVLVPRGRMDSVDDYCASGSGDEYCHSDRNYDTGTGTTYKKHLLRRYCKYLSTKVETL